MNGQPHEHRPASEARTGYQWAYLDEPSKREIRRALLQAVCIPGHLVPFSSRDMPVSRGWGSGGLQITLSMMTPHDVVKVIDQGDDDSMNALTLRGIITGSTNIETTTDARAATLIQTRHRVPEDTLAEDTALVIQVPISDPLRWFESRPTVARRMHAERDYAAAWLTVYEDHSRAGSTTQAAAYPCEVEGGYVITPSPIPRFDVPALDDAPFLALFGAGREHVVYAVPPYTRVTPLTFTDCAFATETFPEPCRLCGAEDSFLTEQIMGSAKQLICSDTARCSRRRSEAQPELVAHTKGLELS